MRPQLLDVRNSNSSDEDILQAEYKQAMNTTKLAGRAVIRVVGRCNDAQENENLDLSECLLMQIPEAVFHLMRNTNLKSCDLSSNVITKIPPKLGSEFSCITELKLSHNRLCRLPDELSQLVSLRLLDFSSNCFLVFPTIAYDLPKLEEINGQHNFIADVDCNRLKATKSLQILNLKENPLRKRTLDGLEKIKEILIYVTPEQSTTEDEDS